MGINKMGNKRVYIISKGNYSANGQGSNNNKTQLKTSSAYFILYTVINCFLILLTM